MNISEYVITFGQKYNQRKKYEMVLLDAVLAFKLLDNAGISQTDHQLALTACNDLKFNTMKAALNRIFRTKSLSANDDILCSIKEESAFMTQGSTDVRRNERRSFPQSRLNKSYNGAKYPEKN